MKFRGAPTYGGGSYYKLIGSVHAGAPARPGDAQIEHGGNAKRDRALRQADAQRVPGAVVAQLAGRQHGKRWAPQGRRDGMATSAYKLLAVDEMANVDPSVYAGLHTVRQETRPNEQPGTNPPQAGAAAVEP